MRAMPAPPLRGSNSRRAIPCRVLGGVGVPRLTRINGWSRGTPGLAACGGRRTCRGGMIGREPLRTYLSSRPALRWVIWLCALVHPSMRLESSCVQSVAGSWATGYASHAIWLHGHPWNRASRWACRDRTCVCDFGDRCSTTELTPIVIRVVDQSPWQVHALLQKGVCPIACLAVAAGRGLHALCSFTFRPSECVRCI